MPLMEKSIGLSLNYFKEYTISIKLAFSFKYTKFQQHKVHHWSEIVLHVQNIVYFDPLRRLNIFRELRNWHTFRFNFSISDQI